jgi:hypothetical protein
MGHMSHVMNVRFLFDDTSLLSVGGNDGSVFQVRMAEALFRHEMRVVWDLFLNVDFDAYSPFAVEACLSRWISIYL